MTPQEIFDKAYIGVVAQGKKSATNMGECAYYGDKHLRCGVGHLLSESGAKAFDSRSRRNLDTDINSILDAGRSKYIEPWMKENQRLLSDIQRAHDNIFNKSEFTEHFKNNMSVIADRYNLKVPEIAE